VDWSAAKLKLASYVPFYDYREQLDLHATYREDARRVRDKRASTVDSADVDLTLTLEGLEDVLAGRDWTGTRMLEVGPKYGLHALWIDEHLQPSELVFSDFAADKHLHEEWEGKLGAPHRWVYGDLRTARELHELEPFDVVFFLGVLYHSAFHLPLLGMLNRVTRLGGELLIETTIDPRPDAALRLRWQRGTGKAKAVPTLDALRIELAWTGWRDVTRFTDYRPDSTEVVLLCRKTDELPDGADLIDLVAPQRPPAEA
jgi:SAM-dependent methyltransferase